MSKHIAYTDRQQKIKLIARALASNIIVSVDSDFGLDDVDLITEIQTELKLIAGQLSIVRFTDAAKFINEQLDTLVTPKKS
jgi:hypothetical protein